MPKVKISLMYVSDYLLSLGSSALEYKSYDNRATLKTGWIHINNNDNVASSFEWTSSRRGDSGGVYRAWSVYPEGHVQWSNVYNKYSVRPVFYLTSEAELSGEGTSTSPYIIK